MLLVLTLVSAVAAFLLAYVNNVTSTTIAKINGEDTGKQVSSRYWVSVPMSRLQLPKRMSMAMSYTKLPVMATG